MKITKQFLISKQACNEGLNYVTENSYLDLPVKKFIEKLMSEDKLVWANWLIVRVMKRKQYLAYAIFAAEQIIDVFEKKYPENTIPRKAIESAKVCLKNDTKKNRAAADAAAADAAAAAANAAAYAADAAYAAAAANAAAAAAADAAAYAAANAAAAAATAAAYADAAYADAAYADDRKNMRVKILKYGLSLLK